MIQVLGLFLAGLIGATTGFLFFLIIALVIKGTYEVVSRNINKTNRD